MNLAASAWLALCAVLWHLSTFENAADLSVDSQINRVPVCSNPPGGGVFEANPETSRVTPSGNAIDLAALGHKIGKAGKM